MRRTDASLGRPRAHLDELLRVEADARVPPRLQAADLLQLAADGACEAPRSVGFSVVREGGTVVAACACMDRLRRWLVNSWMLSRTEATRFYVSPRRLRTNIISRGGPFCNQTDIVPVLCGC